jgi:F0F1-type ATP synthase membrane subunit b/b'
MDALGIFLSDDFVTFSQQIAGLRAEITSLEAEFKEVARAYKKQRAELEDKVKELVAQWDAKVKKGTQ